jgi:hypothetical protein
MIEHSIDVSTSRTFAPKRIDLDDFVACYFGEATHPGSSSHPSQEGNKSERHGREVQPYKNRHNRKETERFKAFAYDDLLKRDKVNLDIFWLKDEALEESANSPPLRTHRTAMRLASYLPRRKREMSPKALRLSSRHHRRRPRRCGTFGINVADLEAASEQFAAVEKDLKE